MLELQFNRLPRSTRARLVDALRLSTSTVWRSRPFSVSIPMQVVAGFLLASMFAWLLMSGQWTEIAVPVVASGLFMMTAVFGLVVSLSWPYRTGAYMFASGLLVAERKRLRWYPLSELSIRPVDRIAAGNIYRRTDIRVWHPASDHHWLVAWRHGSREAAARALQDLASRNAQWGDAWVRGDASMAAGLDPFHEARVNNRWQEPNTAAVGAPRTYSLLPPLTLAARIGVTLTAGALLFAVAPDPEPWEPSERHVDRTYESGPTLSASLAERVPDPDLHALLGHNLEHGARPGTFVLRVERVAVAELDAIDEAMLAEQGGRAAGGSARDSLSAHPRLQTFEYQEAFFRAFLDVTQIHWYANTGWADALESPSDGSLEFTVRVTPQRVATHRVHRRPCALLAWTIELEASSSAGTFRAQTQLPAMQPSAVARERSCYEPQGAYVSRQLQGAIASILRGGPPPIAQGVAL